MRLGAVERLAGGSCCASCARGWACEREAPAKVKAALRRGLELLEEGHGGRGLEPSTVTWARRLVRGEHPTRVKVERAVRWYRRNGRFGQAPEASAMGVAWLLWGGNDGAAWWQRLAEG